jgi:hypothetical protein
MKKVLIFTFMVIFLTASAGMVFSSEKAPQKVVDLANTELAKFGTDPVIVKAVKAENGKNKTLSQVQDMDNKWKGHAGIADYMQALMDSESGAYLKTIQDGAPYYAEIFIMDNQGGNVAMTDKTSDYWQGDEAKFKNSFNNGSGAIFVDEVEFDDSAQVYLVQVSVPVMDGGMAIGAITFGIDVDQIE